MPSFKKLRKKFSKGFVRAKAAGKRVGRGFMGLQKKRAAMGGFGLAGLAASKAMDRGED